MKKVYWFITIIVTALIVCVLIWRFWPHTSSTFISVDKNSLTSFSASADVQCFENGQSRTDTYCIDDTEQQKDEIWDFVSILATSNYQQDFRNLLPWDIDSVSADKNYDGRTVRLTFSSQDAYIDILFLSPSIMVVRTDKPSDLRIYHPTNSVTMDNLVDYLRTHGTKQ